MKFRLLEIFSWINAAPKVPWGDEITKLTTPYDLSLSLQSHLPSLCLSCFATNTSLSILCLSQFSVYHCSFPYISSTLVYPYHHLNQNTLSLILSLSFVYPFSILYLYYHTLFTSNFPSLSFITVLNYSSTHYPLSLFISFVYTFSGKRMKSWTARESTLK